MCSSCVSWTATDGLISLEKMCRNLLSYGEEPALASWLADTLDWWDLYVLKSKSRVGVQVGANMVIHAVKCTTKLRELA